MFPCLTSTFVSFIFFSSSARLTSGFGFEEELTDILGIFGTAVGTDGGGGGGGGAIGTEPLFPCIGLGSFF